jgi:surface antigen
MKKICASVMIGLATLSAAGCSNMSNQDVGTLSGAVAGGLLGSTVGRGNGQLLAVGAGTLMGAYLGGSIGKNMDDQDRARTNAALENNNVGQPAYWRNQNTGVDYKVTPVKNVTHNGNRYCREYTTTAIIAGKTQQVYGTACRQPDGTWKAVS